MDVNPYQAPQGQGEPSPRNTFTGWAMAKDSVKLLVVGLMVSVVGVPVLFVAIAVFYGFLQFMGLPLP